MRGPKPAHPIELTEAEEEQLRRLVRTHTSPHAQVVRAQILLHAHTHPESSNQQIAAQVGTTDRQVRKWRKRWVETHSVADAPRSGAPKRFSPSDPCTGHGHRVQFAQTAPDPAHALELNGVGTVRV